VDRASHLSKAVDCERVAASLDARDPAGRSWVLIVKAG
jgi:hypothetical protein